jgi:glucose-6-phosphate 1-dehydrogenase
VRAQYNGYQKEVSNIGSQTESYASVYLSSRHPHWQGVTLRLVAGKNMEQKQSFIAVHYNDGTNDVFDEAMMLSDDERLPDAYERVLCDAIDGYKAIFTSGDEVLRSWSIIAPVQTQWDSAQGMPQYPPGSHWSDVGI